MTSHGANTRISWERHRNKKLIIQCHNSQAWGHATANCFSPSNCLKCAKNHLTRDCIKSLDTPARCVNCNGPHSANNVNCPVYLRKISTTGTAKRQQQRQVLVDVPLLNQNAWECRDSSQQQPRELEFDLSQFPPLTTVSCYLVATRQSEPRPPLNPDTTNQTRCTWAVSNEDFICVDGNIINIKKICNGIPDCPDASDETKELCYHTICPKEMFRCYYGACVARNSKCNGKNECMDKSDESQCGKNKGSCEKNEFRCKSKECIPVSQMCDGEEHCLDGSDESSVTCEELPCPEESFRCKHGGCIHLGSRCNGENDCIDGSDEMKILCENLNCNGRECVKLRNEVHCPPIDISRLDATCQSKAGGLVPCDNPVPAGTKAKYECRPYFIPVDEKHKDNNHAICQLDGIWNREPLQCQPECGQMNTDPVALVVKGWDTNKITYPWHAQMYTKEDGKWEAWCGGTLITEKVVISAGHCVWKLEAKNIKLAFAKYHSEFEKRNPETQIMDVKEIIIQSLYQDRSGNYGSDISLLILQNPLKLSATIHPACVDWDLRDVGHHLRENSIGLVVGMGLTEDEEFSKTLKGVYLPVVSNEKCMKEQVQDFKKYVTYTVLCAGWKNGTGVCNGDSGGGLLFQKPNDKTRWVLQGIVSVSPRKIGTSYCDPDYYTIFTKVGSYINWLKEVLKKVHQIVN